MHFLFQNRVIISAVDVNYSALVRTILCEVVNRDRSDVVVVCTGFDSPVRNAAPPLLTIVLIPYVATFISWCNDSFEGRA